ncbi:MAG: threonine ammonia-lyase [Clostridia bacterium]|nr:threonine ammonia-lyase [Clostridia bacterium]
MELKQIIEAKERLAGVAHITPCQYSTTFSKMCGNDIYLKCENLQKTGSFKVRGAYNKISKLHSEGNLKSIVASSAGNHAQGCAFAASKMGIEATICMPRTTPIAKVSATSGYGAKVDLYGDFYDDCYKHAREIEKETGAVFIHPFDDEDVMAGQGTLALEMLDSISDLDYILAPVGGGGLLAGIASAVKLSGYKTKVVGIQAAGADALVRSFKEHKHIALDSIYTIADGIAVKNPGIKTLEIINKYADDLVTVTDNEIASTVLHLMERTKMIAEPSGATPLAAMIYDKLGIRGKKVGLVISGGNIDVLTIGKIIEQGLISRKRKIELSVQLFDRPGMLELVSHILAAEGANVVNITYDRMRAGLSINETILHIGCEVDGEEQALKVRQALINAGLKVL